MKPPTVRWLILLLALLLLLPMATFSLLTAFKPPVWLDWQLRMIAGLVVGEYGLSLALIPLCVGVTTWFLRRGHPALTTTILCLCTLTLVLLLKPTFQAWRISRTLPAQLAAAFGPATPERPAFSIAASFSRRPRPVAIETMKYSDSLELDFYRAGPRTAGPSSVPCVVEIHGGAWCRGDRKESTPIRESCCWLADHGYAVASIDYRLAPNAQWPAQRDDVLAAVAFLRAHAASLGIDPARIVLLGRSAGGQLAEATAYAAHDPGIRGVIALYGPADLTLSWTSTRADDSFQQRLILQQFLGGTPKTARPAYEDASSALFIYPGAPPTLLLHGRLDTIVPENQSELLADKLSTVGVPNLLVLLPWATHGFDYVNFASPGAQITTYAIDWFLSAVTR